MQAEIQSLNVPHAGLYPDRLVSRMEAEKLIDDVIKPLREQVAAATAATQKSEDARYMEELTAKAPKWQEIKDNPEFHAWLGETDEFSGSRRFDLARDAMLRGDAKRVAAFYNAFSQVWEDGSTTRNTKAHKGK